MAEAKGTAIITKAKAKELAAQYDNFADETSNLQKEFMKFTKEGQFMHGSEEQVVNDTEEFALNLSTLAKGFICWKVNEVVDEQMKLVSTPGESIQKEDLDDHGPYEKEKDGWRAQAQFDLRSLETGVEMLFKTSSKGGLNAISSISKEFASKLKLLPSEMPVPIVTLEPGYYKHKEFGKIWFPKFIIQRWVLLSEVELKAA